MSPASARPSAAKAEVDSEVTGRARTAVLGRPINDERPTTNGHISSVVRSSLVAALHGLVYPFSAGRLLVDQNVWAAVAPGIGAILRGLLLLAITFAAFHGLGARSPALLDCYERLKWALPGIGGASRRFALCRLARALGALYAAGVAPQE